MEIGPCVQPLLQFSPNFNIRHLSGAYLYIQVKEGREIETARKREVTVCPETAHVVDEGGAL